jgi:drug/metabolite transporter (DMT)-like permease
VPLALVSIPQVSEQHFSFGWKVWLGFGYAIVGPLFLTNILWFTAIDRVGASRASLFANLQPFFAVLFALILLSESLDTLEIVGGVLIFAGIAFERISRRPSAADAVPAGGHAAEADIREAVGRE